jgi:hypothetical protein
MEVKKLERLPHDSISPLVDTFRQKNKLKSLVQHGDNSL